MSLKGHRNANFSRSPRFSGRSGPFFGGSSLPSTSIPLCTFGGFQFRERLRLGYSYADLESLYFADRRPESLPDVKVRAFLKVPASPACGPKRSRRATPSRTGSPLRGPSLNSLDAVEVWVIPVSRARHPWFAPSASPDLLPAISSCSPLLFPLHLAWHSLGLKPCARRLASFCFALIPRALRVSAPPPTFQPSRKPGSMKSCRSPRKSTPPGLGAAATRSPGCPSQTGRKGVTDACISIA
jgi:hypothetical protein